MKEDPARKNGKFIGKRNIPFREEEEAKLLEMAKVLSTVFHGTEDKFSIEFLNDKFDVSSYNVLITIPLKPLRKKVHRLGGPTYFIDDNAKVVLNFAHRLGDNGKGQQEAQSRCFVMFHGIWEREYRHRNKYPYSVNPHFDYGYYVDVIWEDMIVPCMRRLSDDFGLYALGMNTAKLDEYKPEHYGS